MVKRVGKCVYGTSSLRISREKEVQEIDFLLLLLLSPRFSSIPIDEEMVAVLKDEPQLNCAGEKHANLAR